VASHGRLILSGLTVSAVDSHGRPRTSPLPERAFLFSNGGQLVLHHDRLLNLGHLATLASGVSMYDPAPGSEVTGCLIRGAYIGVFVTQAGGVRISGNQIEGSYLYGLEVHTGSTAVSVEGNAILGSGLDGLVLDAQVEGTRILDNSIRDARLSGIVLYNRADGTLVQGNRIFGGLDGIVLVDSSRNRLAANLVQGVERFGLRMDGGSSFNQATGNTFAQARLGVYVYGGSRGNLLGVNRFVADYENVRIRSDATGNRVSPVPPRSELSTP
jgi:parallel beta-helix repeat protein